MKKKQKGKFKNLFLKLNFSNILISIKSFFLKNKNLFIIILTNLIFFLTLFLVIPAPINNLKKQSGVIILDDSDNILRVFLNKYEQWCIPFGAKEKIPPILKITTLTYEDKYFYFHPGINPIAVLRAFIINIKNKKIISGGSTITMQLARIMTPKKRNYINKFIEIFQAIKLEILYSKDEILRFYINYAPYGSNIIGYKAASLKYFKKFPDKLTWSEACTLTILPNAPGIISPIINQSILKEKRNKLLKMLYLKKIIDRETYTLSLEESVPDRIYPIPNHAMHLSQRLYNKYRESENTIRTTININLQNDLEEMILKYSTYIKSQGIKNASILVADTKSGEVKVYIGSNDFFDAENNGQVDGIISDRSTGSLLKPFLYGLCFDEGLIIPQTLIKDIPVNYGSFSPSNSTEKFDGLVKADEALVRSLNIPSVMLLEEYGLNNFYNFLKKAGIESLFRTPDDYGLPLILGGAEATLWDLTKLFRGLGNGGIFQELSIEKNNKGNSNTKLISDASCYLILNILKNLKRPGSEYYWELYENKWPIAWKTGTSYGQKDGWAIGVTPQWTIGIWIGNFSGEGNANLAGPKSAGPILFNVFNYLPKDPAKSWFKKPVNSFKKLNICLKTGYRADQHCPLQAEVEVPKIMNKLDICPYHKNIFTTLDEKNEVCSLCWEQGKYKSIVKLIYSPDINQFFRDSGQMLEKIPPHKNTCPKISSSNDIQILYPKNNARLWIPKDFNGELQKVTLRVAHNMENSIIYWYVDDEYLGKTINKHSIAYSPKKGSHLLKVVDDNGNKEKSYFSVELRE